MSVYANSQTYIENQMWNQQSSLLSDASLC